MKKIITYILLSISPATFSLTFMIPKNGNIIGGIQTAIVQKGETLADIGRKFDLGVYEMIEANPDLDPWYPKAGSKVVIPTKFILPKETNKGIVINLAEMRLYYFHPNGKLVTTHPIGIGKKGWQTPLGDTRITQKKANPTWYPPESIREAHEIDGTPLPAKILPGPKNPLGKYAMKLALPGYLIHGTNRPGGIGVRSSSGCIRMFPEDIKALFNKVSVGTPVKIIHEPYKIGKKGNIIYIEVHQPLSDPYYQNDNNLEKLITNLQQYGLNQNEYILREELQMFLNKPHGYPVIFRSS